MLRKSVYKKTLAVFLILTLTFANTAFVTKSYATTIFETVFNTKKTEDENVVFDAYFETEKDKSYSVISAVNKTPIVNLSLKVSEGYLKNAQVKFKPKNKNANPNFEIIGDFEETEYIKCFEDNTIFLKQINKNTEISLELPLTYIQEEFISLQKISQDINIELLADHVNNKGQETKINNTKCLNLTWVDEREIKLSNEIIKYIPFKNQTETGAILQMLLKVDSTEEKTLPEKSLKLEIEVPKIPGMEISRINVNEKNTNKEQQNSTWNFENGILEIQKEFEPNQEQKYYSSPRTKEYIINYIFKTESEIQTIKNLSTKIKAIITTFETTENIKEQSFEYDISKPISEIVTYEILNETEKVSKGYTYLNYNKNENLFETEFLLKQIINISNKDLVEDIYIEDTTNTYITNTNQTYEQDDTYYKTISISKENFERILSQNGSIEIQKTDGTIIFKINKETITDENGNYTYTFDNYLINKINLKISKPVNEGDLIINISKVQNQCLYDKQTFTNFDYISFNSKLKTKYNNTNKLLEQNTETKTKLENTVTNADLELSTNTFSTLKPTDVEIRIILNNNKIESDIYGNSVFEILLPEYIENFEIKDYSMIYGDGINLTKVETYYNDTGGQIVKAIVEGLQNDINSSLITKGTNIILNCRVTVNKFIPTLEKEMILTYTNNESTNYKEENDIQKIKYIAPKGVLAINSITNYNESENKLTSIKQGIQKAEIKTESISPTMEILLINNNKNPITNIKILGRIPFDGNKDILTGNNLGTTINTIMQTPIIPSENNNINFKIYYSSNEEATNDLNDSSNNWTENMNLEEIKSYLIVQEDISNQMQVSEILKFNYDFNIPENEEINKNLCGNFVVYYENNSELAETDEVSTADLIYLTTETKSGEEFENLSTSEETIDVINIEESEPKEEKTDNEDIQEQTSSAKPTEENNIEKFKITGNVWIDENSDGIKDKKEEQKSSVKVNLVDLETGLIKQTTETNNIGQYEFTDLEKGNYFTVFEYDTNQFGLTSYQKQGEVTKNNSDVISTKFDNTETAITDIIKISDSNISNINMGLVKSKKFDLNLTQTVSKITIQNKNGKLEKEFENTKLAKTKISSKNLDSSVAYIEYKINVENLGDVEGYAKSIANYIPNDLIFNSTLNPDWYIGNDGNIYTTKIANKPIKPGESEELKLILIKQLTEDNSEIINNTAEIVESYNIYGLEDTNFKSANKVDYLNDISSTDVIISVAKGEVFIYTSIILTTILLSGIAIFLIINKFKILKRKEGGV